MYKADKWSDYELIDADNGKRLERWGEYTLVRPDPQVIWSGFAGSEGWRRANATYMRSKTGGGAWSGLDKLPKEWNINYESLGLCFRVRPMGFKHTGLFPEQAANWEWFSELIRNAGRKIRVLNLFAYTGGATVAAAKAGAEVTHVDAARGMVEAARENARLSGLENAPVRWIVDDCRKFVDREIKRGHFYDAVIMDPPSYGRGPTGEVWKLEDNISELVSHTAGVLSDSPLFFLINSYTTGLSPSAMGYILHMNLKRKYGGIIECDEVGIPVSSSGFALPCGSAARWSGC